LRRADLLWKRGLENWIPASRVKDLFPERFSPPPVPSVSRPRPMENAAPVWSAQPTPQTMYDFNPYGAPVQAAPAITPALWNPLGIALWSFFLSWPLGALLVAINWRSLGELKKAKRSMTWFYWALAINGIWGLLIHEITTGTIRPNSELLVPVGLVGLAILLSLVVGWIAWRIVECEPQRKLLKTAFSNRYERRGWFVPVFLYFACIAALVTLEAFVSEVRETFK
jgi:hypothetical protein